MFYGYFCVLYGSAPFSLYLSTFKMADEPPGIHIAQLFTSLFATTISNILGLAYSHLDRRFSPILQQPSLPVRVNPPSQLTADRNVELLLMPITSMEIECRRGSWSTVEHGHLVNAGLLEANANAGKLLVSTAISSVKIVHDMVHIWSCFRVSISLVRG
jgi:hypothetical protein